MESTTNRARRILAYVIDMAICYIPVVLFTLLAQIPFLAGISFSFAIVGVITFFAVFILRDYLFGGRSIGKRLFKLYVVDAASLSAATAKQLIVKNLFLFLTMFIKDTKEDALAVHEHGLALCESGAEKDVLGTILLIVCAVVLFVMMLHISIVFGG